MSMLSHHWGDCWQIMLIINWVAFYLTALILSETRLTNIVVILSFKNKELLITLPKSYTNWHFIRQLSVLNWVTKGVSIFSSIMVLENLLVIAYKFLTIPTASSLLLMKVMMMGSISSLMTAGLQTSARPTMCSDI